MSTEVFDEKQATKPDYDIWLGHSSLPLTALCYLLFPDEITEWTNDKKQIEKFANMRPCSGKAHEVYFNALISIDDGTLNVRRSRIPGMAGFWAYTEEFLFGWAQERYPESPLFESAGDPEEVLAALRTVGARPTVEEVVPALSTDGVQPAANFYCIRYSNDGGWTPLNFDEYKAEHLKRKENELFADLRGNEREYGKLTANGEWISGTLSKTEAQIVAEVVSHADFVNVDNLGLNVDYPRKRFENARRKMDVEIKGVWRAFEQKRKHNEYRFNREKVKHCILLPLPDPPT